MFVVLFVILLSTASLLPTFVSRTVNLGDNVSLTVSSDKENDGTLYSKWRKDNGNVIKSDTLEFIISSVSTSDSGVYECHYKHKRGEGNHALLRLVV